MTIAIKQKYVNTNQQQKLHSHYSCFV
jgi:hypothetical protein